MIELSRTQDEECGDGTTSVIILGAYPPNYTKSCSIIAGEILSQSLSQLERDIHPVVIISAYNKALKEALEIITRISIPIDINPAGAFPSLCSHMRMSGGQVDGCSQNTSSLPSSIPVSVNRAK